MDDLDKKIEEYLAQIPDSTRKILQEFNWLEKVQEIADKRGLLLDEARILERETTLTLLGIEDPAQFQFNLRKHMGITDELAQTLVRELNMHVFMPIQEQVLETHKGELEQRELRFEAGDTISMGGSGDLKRDEVLAGIEDPKEEKKEGVVHKKLKDFFSSKPEKTDYSPQTVSYDEGDPYQEPID